MNGTLGFRGAVGSLQVVSIKDTNNGSVSTTDDKSYLGVQISGLTADLIGLESILEFHAEAVNVKVNKATDTDNNVATVPAKLDWDSLTTSGMPLASLAVDSALDVVSEQAGQGLWKEIERGTKGKIDERVEGNEQSHGGSPFRRCGAKIGWACGTTPPCHRRGAGTITSQVIFVRRAAATASSQDPDVALL